MTFEQWWAHEKWDGIDIATVEEAAILRRIAATCWNAAVDAYHELICERAIDPDGLHPVEPEDVKAKL